MYISYLIAVSFDFDNAAVTWPASVPSVNPLATTSMMTSAVVQMESNDSDAYLTLEGESNPSIFNGEAASDITRFQGS